MSEQTRPEETRERGRASRLEMYRRLRTHVAELQERMGGLPSPAESEAAGIWRDIWYEEAHHSTALEGNTLAIKQVERLLAEGQAVGNRQLHEYLEVRGYADAADWIYRQAMNPTGLSHHGRLLTTAEVREIHRIAMTPAWDVTPHPDATDREAPGNYRTHDIQPFPGGMTPVTWPLIGAELTAWVDDVNTVDGNSLTFPEALGMLHGRFERIHPFLDGNGRTGRLVLNLILVRLGYPPVVIRKRDRDRYLRALRRADTGVTGPLGDMLARAILDSLYRFVLPAVAGPARLVPLEALATPDLGVPALRSAAGRGRLQATRGNDGRWRSTQQWVDEYKQTRYKRTTPATVPT